MYQLGFTDGFRIHRGFDSKSLQLPDKPVVLSGRASKITGNSGDHRRRESTSGILQKRQYEKVILY